MELICAHAGMGWQGLIEEGFKAELLKAASGWQVIYMSENTPDGNKQQ